MKKIVFLIIVLFTCSVNAETLSEEATFKRCVDGDTAVFIINDQETKIRFLAIDTPETVHPTKNVELYGKDASEYTCNKLTNAKEIIVEYEMSNKTDKYGRTLGWIWVDGVLLQSEIIKIGYAEVAYIYGNYRYTESLCIEENDAREEKIGIWQDENREQKYCATIEVDESNYNIDYGRIIDYDSETNQQNNEGQKAENKMQQLDETTSKISDYLNNNEEEIGDYLFYIIVIASVFSIIKKANK